MKPGNHGLESNELFQALLAEAAGRHAHLCPRQVLGVRLGLRGLRALGLVPKDYTQGFANDEKRLLTIVETDGCGADGIAVATRCEVGRRTLRVEDYGKVAATLVDTQTGQCVRVAPRAEARNLASDYAPEAATLWHAYLVGYQRIPDALLVSVRTVRLRQSLESILSQPGLRAVCGRCGEEIMNERELLVGDEWLCRACAGNAYYQELSAFEE